MILSQQCYVSHCSTFHVCNFCLRLLIGERKLSRWYTMLVLLLTLALLSKHCKLHKSRMYRPEMSSKCTKALAEL